MSDSQLADLLSIDPIATAERVTGADYKENEETSALGMLLTIAHGGAKDRALEATDDTKLSNDVPRYERILREEGFGLVLEEGFLGSGYGDSSTATVPEKLALWWHPDGLLLRFDTFGGAEDHVNAASVWYNWQPNDGLEFGVYWPALSSHEGRREDGVFAGNHDAREALRFNLRRLRRLGSFVSPWVARPFLWLLHYMDTKGQYDHAAINAARMAKLPDHVLTAISPAGAK